MLAATYSVTGEPVWEKSGVWIATNGGYPISSGWTISGYVDSGDKCRTYVWSKGVAQDFVRNGDGRLEIYNKGVVSGLLIQKATVYHPIIYSGGTLYNVTANITGGAIRALFDCSAGGVVSHVRDTATHSVAQNIGICGSVYDVSLSRSIGLEVSSGGYLSGCSLMQNLPILKVFSGGSVDNLWASAYTSQQILVYPGGVLNTLWASSADININGTASNIRFQDNTLRMSGASVYNVSTFNAALQISSSYISGWTMLRLKNGGTAPLLAADVVSDFVWSITVNNASYTMKIDSGTSLIGGSMYDGIRAQVAASNTYVQDVEVGRTADTKASTSLLFSGTLTGGRYMVASNIVISSGGAVGFLAGGRSAYGLYLHGGHFYANAGDNVLENVVIASGYALISNSNVAVNVVVSSGGSFTVSSGGTAVDVTSNPGAVIRREGGGVIYYVGSPGPVYGFYGAFAESDGSGLESGMSLGTVNPAKTIYVFNSGYVDSVVASNASVYVNSGGSIGYITNVANQRVSMYLSDGGKIDSISLLSASDYPVIYGYGSGGSVGTVELTSTMNARRMFIAGPVNAGILRQYSYAGTEWFSGAICSHAIISANHMCISSGATALAVSVYETGHVSVFSGGTALGVVNNGGEVWSEDGAVVEYA